MYSAQDLSGDKPAMALRWFQRALAQSNNDEDAARVWLEANASDLDKQDKQEADRRARSMKGSLAAGFYRDTKTGMEVNVQSAEVYVAGRALFPMPAGVSCHAQFQAIFGGNTPLCALMDTTRYRTRYEVRHLVHRIVISSWTDGYRGKAVPVPPPKSAKLSRDALTMPAVEPRPVMQNDAKLIGVVAEDFRNQSILEIIPNGDISREGDGWRPDMDDKLPFSSEDGAGGDADGASDTPSDESVQDLFYWGQPLIREGVVFYNGQRYSREYVADDAGWLGEILGSSQHLPYPSNIEKKQAKVWISD